MQWHTLAGYDFQPNISKVEYDTSGGGVFLEDGGPVGAFTANLDLPDGDVIYSLCFFYKKLPGASGNLTFAVKTYNPSTGLVSVIQSDNTNDVLADYFLHQLSFSGTVAGLGKMDAQDVNLRLEVSPSTADEDLRLYGAQVQFFFPAEVYMPLIFN